MGKAILAAMVAVTLLGVAADGHAQPVSRPSVAQSGVTQQGRPSLPPPPRVQTPGLEQPTGPTPLFNLFGGLPVYLSTPVAAPYSGSSYRTLGGQPQRSGDSLLQGAGAP